jgi:hypothetical protein
METVEEASAGITIGNMDRAERTLQFYALRNGWNWAQTYQKTRNPTKEIQDKFGHDLDPITLIGLHPTSPVRPMTAYDRRWEIVDLGRNQKKAKVILEALKEESSREHNLRAALDQDPMPKILTWINHDAKRVTTTRNKVAKHVEEGDVHSLMRHYGGHDIKGFIMSEVIGEIIRKIGESISEGSTGADVLGLLDYQLKKLEDDLEYQSDPCDEYSPNMFKLAQSVYKRLGWVKARKILRAKRRDLAFVVNARTTISNRYSPPGIPADLRR